MEPCHRSNGPSPRLTRGPVSTAPEFFRALKSPSTFSCTDRLPAHPVAHAAGLYARRNLGNRPTQVHSISAPVKRAAGILCFERWCYPCASAPGDLASAVDSIPATSDRPVPQCRARVDCICRRSSNLVFRRDCVAGIVARARATGTRNSLVR